MWFVEFLNLVKYKGEWIYLKNLASSMQRKTASAVRK